MTLTDNLIAHWSLGGTADDHGANTLTNTNTVTFTAGLVGNAATLVAASSQRLQAADSVALSTGDIDYSFTFWLKYTTNTTGMAVISKEDSSSQREFRIDVQSAALRWVVFDSGGNVVGIVTHGTGLSNGTWYFVYAYHSATSNQVGISINNGTAATAATTGAAGDSTASLYLGFYFGGSYLNGQLDEMDFRKGLVSGPDLTTLYNGGAGLAYASYAAAGQPMALRQTLNRTGAQSFGRGIV